MKKFLTILLIAVMTLFCSTLTGCAEIMDIFDLAIENQLLKEENKELRQQIFDIFYPDGIIDEDFEVKSIERVVSEGEGDAIQVIGSATVTITDGIFDGGQTPLGGAGNTAIWCNSQDAKIIINGGTFKIKGLANGDTGHIDLIYCSAGTIEINNGYFEGADSTVWLLNCKDINYQNSTAQIIVKGGTFKNFDPSNCISEGEGTNFVAEGYEVISELINDGIEEYTLYKVVKTQI